MSKIELFKKIYDTSGLTTGLMYEMLAEYNGGQIEIEFMTTLSSGRKKRNIVRGVIDFIVSENINGQDIVRIIWQWVAVKAIKQGYYLLANYRHLSFTKYQGEYLGKNPNYDDSMILLILDEDEDEIKADPNGYKVVKIEFIDGHDPNYLPWEKIKK